MNKNAGITYSDKFLSLAKVAYFDHLDKYNVSEYFKAYEDEGCYFQEDEIKYLQLKYYREERKWAYLNQLAHIYHDQKRYSLALMCLSESLRLNEGQPDVFEFFKQLKRKVKLYYPNKMAHYMCKVSVIICTQGIRLGELKESLESVFSQTFQDFEIVLVNDGGSEGVLKVISLFDQKKINYIKVDCPAGVSHARNVAIMNSSGEYVAYLDDDDVYYPTHLEMLLEAINESGLKIAYSNTQGMLGKIINGRFKHDRRLFSWCSDFNKDKLCGEIYITTCTILHRKDIFNQIGLFNEDLLQTQDWDLWLRMALKYEFAHVDQSTSEYRIKADNRTITNRLGGHFYGDIVCRNYNYYQGEIAVIKHHKFLGEIDKAKRLYLRAAARYDQGFKTLGNAKELINLALAFNDKRIIRKLICSGFKNNARQCLKFILHKRSVLMFIYVSPMVICRTAHVIKRRIVLLVNQGRCLRQQKNKKVSYET